MPLAIAQTSGAVPAPPPASPAVAAPAPATAQAAVTTPVKTQVNPKDGLTYVLIAPGKFLMGCSPKDDECFEDEKSHTKLR